MYHLWPNHLEKKKYEVLKINEHFCVQSKVRKTQMNFTSRVQKRSEFYFIYESIVQTHSKSEGKKSTTKYFELMFSKYLGSYESFSVIHFSETKMIQKSFQCINIDSAGSVCEHTHCYL